jgi:hypothetical protein
MIMKKEAGKTKMAPNKFNYNGDKEKKNHDQMEIMNGQEMIYNMIENQMLTSKREREKRLLEVLEWVMKVVLETLRTWGASSDTFGEDLVKGIEVSQKKEDADRAIFHLGLILNYYHLVKR